MVGGLASARSAPHLITAAELAATAGVLTDPDLAQQRLSSFRSVMGLA